MNCSKVEELEDSYLLGELEEEEAAELEWHLQDCLSCTGRLATSNEALGRLFAAVEPVPPPARVRGALLDKVNALQTPAPAPVIPIESRRRKRVGWPSIGWVAGIAAA